MSAFSESGAADARPSCQKTPTRVRHVMRRKRCESCNRLAYELTLVDGNLLCGTCNRPTVITPGKRIQTAAVKIPSRVCQHLRRTSIPAKSARGVPITTCDGCGKRF